MAIVTLEQAKSHCRVTHDFEDSVIELCMEAADDYIKDFLNRETVPNRSKVKQAALMIIHDLYNNRGAQTAEKQYKNSAVDALLYPLRRGIGI
jgi:uncharacterized phage protein (predicted DNA packaging)